MTVGNLGDGAAVLCRGGQAVPLSTAQTPGRPDETARIERANGCVRASDVEGMRVMGSYLNPRPCIPHRWVTEERELFVGRLHRMDLQDPTIAQVRKSGIG